MKIEVEGYRIVVTAGARGIGRAIVEAFAQNGAKVHLCDIDELALQACLTAVSETTDATPTGTVCNVGNPQQVDIFMSEAIENLGGIDVLVNNAGIAGPAGPVETVTQDGLLDTLNVNLGSQFYTAKHAIPLMKAQRSGTIINIASTAGQYGFPYRSPYCTSKWAIIGLTKTMAMELGEFNVRANVICPGSINNERMAQVIQLEHEVTGIPKAQVREGFLKQVSMQTFIDPEEIAQMALFLSSPLGKHISGQAVAIDGHTETMRNQ